MNTPRIVMVALLISGMSCGWAAWPSESSAVALKGGDTPDQIQQAYNQAITALVPSLGYGKESNKALQKLEATVHHAARPGAELERTALCKAVGAALQGDAAVDAKTWLLRQIAFVGRAELVPALAGLRDDKEPLLRESARGALEHNPAPEAAQALRTALARAAEPAWQGALALALGARKDASSVPLLVTLLDQKNEAAVEAALCALGNIASADAAKALTDHRQAMPEKLRAAAAESSMKCAEQMLKRGNAGGAASIYLDMSQPPWARPVRLAALQGLLRSAGDAAGDKILDMLSGDDADARAIATGYVPELSSGGLKKLAAGLDRLAPVTQATMLGILAERGEKSALPVAMNFARSNDEATRLSGLTALGRLGDATTVAFLVPTLQAGGSTASTAKDSLLKLDGAGVNEQIITALQRESDVARRSDLITVLEARSASVAVPVLLPEALGDNATLRRSALRALGRLAEPKDAPIMLRALLKSTPGSERDEAERAIVSVCARSTEPGRQADPVLEMYRDANPADRLVLLSVLGRLGGARSLEAVKSALASSDTATYQAGVNAISNWPDSDSAVEDELLVLAQRADRSNDRALALRAYVRVISMPSGLPDVEKLKRFQKAMELAERDSERNFVLERVTDLHRIETLRFVVPWLDKPAQMQRACVTILDLARDRGLRGQNKAEFEQALNKVLALSKDQAQVERAKRYLGER